MLDGTHATGTVALASNARLWFVPAARAARYLAANPDIASALHEGFARALRQADQREYADRRPRVGRVTAAPSRASNLSSAAARARA